MSSLNSWALISLDELKEALEITGNSQDSRLNGYINRATDLIESYVDRRLKATDYTNEEYSGDNTPYLKLKQWPINTVTSVQRRLGFDFNSNTWESINSGLFKIVNDGGTNYGVIYIVDGFFLLPTPPGVDNYRVSYNAGLSTIPGDLKEACIDITNYLFNSRKRDPSLTGERLGKYSYTRDANAMQGGIIKMLGLEDILDGYRNIPI